MCVLLEMFRRTSNCQELVTKYQRVRVGGEGVGVDTFYKFTTVVLSRNQRNNKSELSFGASPDGSNLVSMM